MSTEHRLIKAGTAAQATQSTWSILSAVVDGLEQGDVKNLHPYAGVALESLKDRVRRIGDELEVVEKLIDDLRSRAARQEAVKAGVVSKARFGGAPHGGMLALHRRLDAAGVPQEDRIDFLEWAGRNATAPLSASSVAVLASMFEHFKAAAR